MFDIGFSEIVVIAVVALVVIGPERLPKAARTMGHLFGRLQRYVNDVKSDINRELELDELRKLQKQVQTAAQDLKSSVESTARDVQVGMRSVEDQLNAGAADLGDPMATSPPPDNEGLRSPSDPVRGAGEPDREMAAVLATPPRQPSLPGFDKI